MTFDEQIDELLRDPSPANAKKLKRRIFDFVVEHINSRDEWDQDWPEIGHVWLADKCKCKHCKGR